MLRRFIFILSLMPALVVGSRLVSSSAGGRPSVATLDCAVDVCSFRGPRGLTRLELYLELAAERLVVSDSLDAALFRVEVSATPIDASGHDEPHPYENVWRRGVAAGAGGLRGRVVGDVFQFDLVPGEYAMQARVADEVGRGSWERQWRLDVPDYDSEDLRTSGRPVPR